MRLPIIIAHPTDYCGHLGPRDLERDLGLRRRREAGQPGLGRGSDRIIPELALGPAALDRLSAGEYALSVQSQPQDQVRRRPN